MVYLCIVSIFSLLVVLTTADLDIPRRSFQWPKPAGGFVPQSTKGFHVPASVKITGFDLKDQVVQTAAIEFTDEIKGIQEAKCVISLEAISEINVDVKTYVKLMPGVNEGYTLALKDSRIFIIAETQFGARHALVTLQNMLELRSCNTHKKFANTDFGGSGGYFVLPFDEFEFQDSPRLSHRGLMLDTARGFVTATTIERILFTMSRVKMNVFHWHATDDQSFPLVMKSSASMIHGEGGVDCASSDDKPCLGSFSNTKTYNEEAIRRIVSFAETHGIRVIFEVDMPAHARSWAATNNDLSECSDLDHQLNEICAELTCGPLALNSNYDNVLNIAKLIIDDLDRLSLEGERIHVGMDEVSPGCWGKQTRDQLMMKWLKDITTYAASKNRRLIVWQDVVGDHEGAPQPPEVMQEKVMVQVWNEPSQGLPLLEKGHDLIWSNKMAVYLDHGIGNHNVPTYGFPSFHPWWTVYEESPDLFFPNYKDQIIGGEVCMWSEKANDRNIESLIWPRAAAWAGASWETRDHVPYSTGDYENEMLVPQEHIQRFSFAMFRRDIPFMPIHTMWCYYGDTVGNTEGRNYCDHYASGLLKPQPTEIPQSTQSSANLEDGSAKSLPLTIVALIVAAMLLA